MISKVELKRIAAVRLRDAEALIAVNRFDGATHLCGHAVEVGLKITNLQDPKMARFPETNSEFQGLLSFKTHDFDTFLRLSGVEVSIKSLCFAEWSDLKP